jgi:hypothetical protein
MLSNFGSHQMLKSPGIFLNDIQLKKRMQKVRVKFNL